MNPFHMPPAYGAQLGQGVLRQQPDDFRVSEIPITEPSGTGEHVWVRLRKTGQNTAWVAEQLARFAGIHPRDVGYAGLKDRDAVTEQWFSLHLPGKPTPDWTGFVCEGVEILLCDRHDRKLKRGGLRGNRFRIRVRDFDGDPAALAVRWQQISTGGIPNYFGEQRFGHGGNNLQAALEMFAQARKRIARHKRSLYISAARSHLFNQVLARRVETGKWNNCTDGDIMQLNGSHAQFAVEACDESIIERLRILDIHPTGPLWGRGRLPSQAACADLEQDVLNEYTALRSGLEHVGLDMERRALRVRVQDAELQQDGNDIVLQFTLPAGSYATVLLQQLITTQ